MSARKLAANVVVGGVMYRAGSTPPAEVAEWITNPKAWGTDPEPEATDEPAPKPVKKAAANRSSKK